MRWDQGREAIDRMLAYRHRSDRLSYLATWSAAVSIWRLAADADALLPGRHLWALRELRQIPIRPRSRFPKPKLVHLVGS